MEDLKDTIDNGQTEVQIATIGDVVGTGVDGRPVEQHLTEDSLKALAEKHKDDEILVDADHESEIGDKTEAKGWLSGLFVKPGVGLFGKIKWTDIGKKLIENRVFRWLSPSWILDKETKEPMYMTSIALTNKPSQKNSIKPIVNSAPMKIENSEKGILDMTKEELAAMVAEMIDAKIAEAAKAEVVEEVKEEVKEEVVDNGCSEDNKEVVNEEPEKVEETKTEEVVEKTEEVKEEEKKEDETDSKEEVIKLEALNSAPKTAGLDVMKGNGAKWQTLSGKDFIDWVNNGCK